MIWSQIMSVQNTIDEIGQIMNFHQTNNKQSIYLKKILEVENKCQYWMDKYDELHIKYDQLEFKYMRTEKENCGKSKISSECN